MNKKEYFQSLLAESKLSETELKKKFYPHLYKVYPDFKVKEKADKIVSGKLDDVTDEVIEELIKLLGVTIPSNIEENKEEEKDVTPVENKNILDQHNTLLVENSQLKQEVKQLTEQLKEALDKTQKLEKFAEAMKKFNLTEKSNLINVDDNDINDLFVAYTIEGKTSLNNALILEKDNKAILPKSYYQVEK